MLTGHVEQHPSKICRCRSGRRGVHVGPHVLKVRATDPTAFILDLDGHVLLASRHDHLYPPHGTTKQDGACLVTASSYEGVCKETMASDE